MELYNFFSEVVSEKDTEKVVELLYAFKEIKDLRVESVDLVITTGYSTKSEKKYSIIGQMYGEDTNVGDTDLLVAFGNIKYIWFDAYCPKVNNIT